MASLYELTNEFERMIAQSEEATTQEEVEAIYDRLDEIGGEIEGKGEIYARILKNKQAEAEAYKAEIARLTALKRASEMTVDRLKARMLDAMTVSGKMTIETAIGKWKVAKAPWSVTVTDLKKIDPEWLIPQEPAVDKAGMLRHFKETGEILDGVQFEQKDYVRFK